MKDYPKIPLMELLRMERELNYELLEAASRKSISVVASELFPPEPSSYDELIDFLCPSAMNSTPLLPKEKPWRPTFTKLVEEFYKALDLLNNPIKQSQMKQQKFNKADMISVTTPRGTTVAILAEDFTYEKPQMVAVKTMLTYDGILTISDEVGQGQLYIHQDCLGVLLANEQEGLRLFSAIRASGVEYPSVKEKAPVFKDGDFLYASTHLGRWIVIFEEMRNCTLGRMRYHVMLDACDRLQINHECNHEGFRLATPSERQLLLDALAADGKTWNATEKMVEKVLWRAKNGERYYETSYSNGVLIPSATKELGGEYDNTQHSLGDYFQHESDCQLLCDQLNAVIKTNKEERIKLN